MPYTAAVLAVLLGAALRLAFDPLAGDFYVFTLYYALVPLIAWAFGLKAGLLAVALSALLVNFGLLEPRGQFSTQAAALFGSLSFLLIGSGLAWFGDRLRRSRDQLRAKARELEREVDERKHAEAEVERLNALLRQRLEELQAVIQASPLAIGVASDAGCEQVRGNQAFIELFDVPGDAVEPGAPADEPLPFRLPRGSLGASAVKLPMTRCAREGCRVRNEEIEVARPDGAARTVLANAAPLHDAGGQVRGCVGIFVDISARKAVEREREEMNRRKDEFLATLAHELRNPLAPLRNVAALMQQQQAGDRRSRWISDVIERQVRHMARLVDDLLDLARVNRGLVSLRCEAVELRALVEQALELVRPLAEERGQRLDVALPLEPVALEVDRVRITQVFANILHNAVKYTPEGGWIRVSARTEGPHVMFTVRDSGRGIAAELLPQIFDVFVQGDRTLARSEGGLGLGLPLVKKLVELHHGSVSASSPGPGQGSELTVTLPLAGQAVAADAAPAPVSGRSRHRVLVVDDNVDVADTLTVLLGSIGHEARAAYSAETALTMARAFSPSVALLDIGLPDVDGYTLAARFRADASLRAVRLIALSGYGAERDRARSAAAGFEHHLTKPYRLDQLEAALGEIDATGAAPVLARVAPGTDFAVD